MKIGRTTFVLAALANATALVAACAPSTPPTPAASPPRLRRGGTSAVAGARRSSASDARDLVPELERRVPRTGHGPGHGSEGRGRHDIREPARERLWRLEAIENSSIALAEAANLLTIPGRMCANGKPVPVQSADWQRFVQGLRDAGMASYKAAQTKDMDKMLDAADTLTNACSECHDVYREKSEQRGGDAARCTAQ
jgi:hypothetical protein